MHKLMILKFFDLTEGFTVTNTFDKRQIYKQTKSRLKTLKQILRIWTVFCEHTVEYFHFLNIQI